MKPTLMPGESMADFFKRLDAWKEQGDWFPANNGTEVPFRTRGGRRLLYCYQPRTGRHAYLDMDSDYIVPNEEIALYLG